MPGDLFDYTFDSDGDPITASISHPATQELNHNRLPHSTKTDNSSSEVIWLRPKLEAV